MFSTLIILRNTDTMTLNYTYYASYSSNEHQIPVLCCSLFFVLLSVLLNYFTKSVAKTTRMSNIHKISEINVV